MGCSLWPEPAGPPRPPRVSGMQETQSGGRRAQRLSRLPTRRRGEGPGCWGTGQGAPGLYTDQLVLRAGKYLFWFKWTPCHKDHLVVINNTYFQIICHALGLVENSNRAPFKGDFKWVGFKEGWRGRLAGRGEGQDEGLGGQAGAGARSCQVGVSAPVEGAFERRVGSFREPFTKWDTEELSLVG